MNDDEPEGANGSRFSLEKTRENTGGRNDRIFNNTNEDSDWRQYGGTGLTMSPLFRSHHISHGSDPTKLGRWTHARFRGNANTAIRTIAAYHPCNSDVGIDTMWNQHVRYFQEHDNIANPNHVALFDRDLLNDMKRWL